MAGIFSHLFFTHRDKPGGALGIQTPPASGVARSLSRRNWEVRPIPVTGLAGTALARAVLDVIAAVRPQLSFDNVVRIGGRCRAHQARMPIPRQHSLPKSISCQ